MYIINDRPLDKLGFHTIYIYILFCGPLKYNMPNICILNLYEIHFIPKMTLEFFFLFEQLYLLNHRSRHRPNQEIKLLC